MVCRLGAPNRPALRTVTGIGRRERHDEGSTVHLGHHQPVNGRFGWVEERVGAPNVVDVVDPEPGMLEEVGGLFVDLEGVIII